METIEGVAAGCNGASPAKAELNKAEIENTREALQSSADWGKLSQAPLCRESQYNSLRTFIKGCFEDATGGGAYLSGVPGTGKSLTAHAVLRSVADFEPLDNSPSALISINCMGLPDAKSVYKMLLQGFIDHCMGPSMKYIAFPCSNTISDAKPSPGLLQGNAEEDWEKLVMTSRGSSEKKSKGSSRKRRRSCVEDKRGMIIVLLDEMDGLLSKDASLIYNLFKLAKASPRFILIGAANSLDLTERILPKLDAHDCQPNQIVFPAYKAIEATKVVQQRLSKCNGSVFDESAIRLCAKKVSAHSGDMRQVLEACTSAMNAATADVSEKLSENQGPFLVGPREMLQTLGNMQDAKSNSSTKDLVRGLPLSQQVLLFAVWQQTDQASKSSMVTPSTRQRSSSAGISSSRRQKQRDLMKLGNVYERYANVCGQLEIDCNPLSEAFQMASCLHDAALIELESKRAYKEARATLRVDQSVLEAVFKDRILFRDCLSRSMKESVL